MTFDLKILSSLLVISFLWVAPSANATDNYEYVDSSDLSFEVTFENNLYNGTVTEFINPVTKRSGLYVKIKDTRITSFTCNGQNIEIKNNKIDDSILETTKYGKIKIGLWGQRSNDVIVWVTPEQKKALQELTSSKQSQSIFPTLGKDLKGNNEVRVKNPNDFEVTVGLRSGNSGKDFSVAANGIASVFVPDSVYQIYFVYSNKPDALFQGDDFSLNNNGIEIKIVKVVGGNYGIKQVK
jgi:hypothetical protein